MDNQPSLHGQYAALLLDLLTLTPHQKRALMAECNIRPALLSSQDAFLTHAQTESLIEHALTLSGNPTLGLHFGERLNLMTHGALGQAVLSCHNLKHAIDLMLKYYRTRMLHVSIELIYEQDDAVLTFDIAHSSSAAYRFLVETIFVCLVRTSMFFFGMKLMYQGNVEVTYPLPDIHKNYQSTFYQGIQFDAKRNALSFKKTLLDLPMAMPNPSALDQAEQACYQLMERLPQQTSLVEQVKALMFSPTGEQASIEELAAMLHMSSRTLRRKLAEQAHSYRQLANHAKVERACQLLSDGHSVESVAEQLKYSDPSNFGRAFKRIIGVSPSEHQSTPS